MTDENTIPDDGQPHIVNVHITQPPDSHMLVGVLDGFEFYISWGPHWGPDDADEAYTDDANYFVEIKNNKISYQTTDSDLVKAGIKEIDSFVYRPGTFIWDISVDWQDVDTQVSLFIITDSDEIPSPDTVMEIVHYLDAYPTG